MSTYKYKVVWAGGGQTEIENILNNLPDGYRPTVGAGLYIVCEKLEWDKADLEITDPDAQPVFGVPMRVQ
jgi:hypothetical protein